MSKKYFIKFVSEPKNDPIKSIVGIACTAQAIADGHDVSVFFAAAGTRLLNPEYIDELNQEMQWSYDSQENISSYMSGDTLQEMWYQYKEYKYNSKNDLVSEYTNMEMDGRARLTFEAWV